jgi:hypothetical protein
VYTGEQWRLGQSGRGADRLDFQYNLTTTSLTTPTGWVDVNALDFSSPITTGTVGALDGNAAANRTPVSGTISALSIAPGQTFWIRWFDFNVTGSDDGLGVDDFSLTPHAAHTISVADATVTEGDSGTTTASFAVSLSTPAPAGGVTFDIATSDGSAQAPDDYTASSVTGATIPEGASSYTFDVSVNGDTTEPDEIFSVDLSNVTGVDPGDTHAVGTILNDDFPPPVPIHDIQGVAHISPLVGERPRVLGIVTARSTNGFWMQDPSPDSDPTTSEGIFVFTGSAAAVVVGDSFRVQGTVQEFRPGGAASGNLTTTELSGSPSVTVLSPGNPLPAPVVIGTGGRIPPDTVIEDDASGSVETSGVFDPGQDGLDFYESLEGMRVELNDAVAVGPTATSFGETPVVGDNGANASMRTARGGVLLRPDDANPERVTLDDLFTPLPSVNVGDHYSASIVGVMDYNFGNPFIEVTTPGLTAVHDGVTPETTDSVAPGELAVSTFNFENLDPGDPQTKFDRLADEIVDNLRSPDLIAGEEVQDNNGPDGRRCRRREPDARPARCDDPGSRRAGVRVAGDRPGRRSGRRRAGRQHPPGVPLPYRSRPLLRRSAGRRRDDAERGHRLRLLGAAPLKPGSRRSRRRRLERVAQAAGGRALLPRPQALRDCQPLQLEGRRRPAPRPLPAAHAGHGGPAAPAGAPGRGLRLSGRRCRPVGERGRPRRPERLRVLGDRRDHRGRRLHDLMNTLPPNQRYSYDFEGNSQVLDHILVSGPLFARPLVFDPVHVNAEFSDQASDHDPSVVRILINDPPTADFNAPASTFAGFPFELSLTNPSGPEPGETFTYAFDCGSGYGAFAASSTASCPTADVGDRSVGGKVRDELGAVTEYRGTVRVIVTFDSLCSLAHSYALHQDDADELCALLDAAEAASNPKTRANTLKSFRKTVDGMTGPQPGKSFTAEQGAELKLLSTRLA